MARRYFYGLDINKAIDDISASCHQCRSLQKVPKTVIPQSTSDPPNVVGAAFSADVLQRERQKILVVRENITSYTSAAVIEDERSHTLREALVRSCVELSLCDGPMSVVRTDPAPGFVALQGDEFLRRHRISVEVGVLKMSTKIL